MFLIYSLTTLYMHIMCFDNTDPYYTLIPILATLNFFFPHIS